MNWESTFERDRERAAVGNGPGPMLTAVIYVYRDDVEIALGICGCIEGFAYLDGVPRLLDGTAWDGKLTDDEIGQAEQAIIDADRHEYEMSMGGEP
jgi:hypothetical protein